MPFAEGYNKLKSKAEQLVESVKTSKLLSQNKDVPLPYAYPCDNYMDSILSNGLVRKTLQLFADKYCKEQIQNIKSTGQLVCKDNYPRFHNILKNCCKSLNVDEMPEVYITNQLKGINALSVGTDNAPIILISRKSIVSLSDGELKFMVGHELGHILQKNLMCHMIKGMLDNLNSKSEVLGPIISDLIDVPLKQWYKCSEYTADRAGYLCCRDYDIIRTLFTKLLTDDSPTAFSHYKRLSLSYPSKESRIKELGNYIKKEVE